MREQNVLIFNTGAPGVGNPNVPLNAAVTQTSIAIPLDHIFGWSGQVVFTGSPNGILIAQASDDPYGNNPQFANTQLPINWTPITDATFTITTSGNCMFNVREAFYNWIQFVWTPSSGSGTLTGRVKLKGV